MDILISPNTRLFIIEGIPGAGKNTFHQMLKEQLQNKVIYDFAEEELLFTWKQAWIRNIDEMRLTFFENLLIYCEECLQENPDAIFILNRFHISYMIFHTAYSIEKQERYNKLLEKLKELGTCVYVPLIDERDIEHRSIHIERTDPIWQKHLGKRLQERGYTTLKDMYSAEQIKIQELLKSQGIPYQILTVNIKKY